MSRHITVPVFVPHAGCPHRCSFCNQRSISGKQSVPTPDDVRAIIRGAADNLGERMRFAELAFFGGSFTAVEEPLRLALLSAAAPYVGGQGFRGIRVSTRPDRITPRILEQLRHYQVTTIELGVQSMRDPVLLANDRGHTAKHVRDASRLIRGWGFSLGHQMMVGLHGDDARGVMETAREIASMGPDMVRVYPTLVLRGTRLAELYGAGKYKPFTLDETVALGGKLLEFFDRVGIPVIRFGLQEETGLGDEVLAGPHHPALRELCQGELLLRRARRLIRDAALPAGEVQLWVHPRSVSKMAGHRRRNILRLAESGYQARIRTDPALTELAVRITRG